MVVESSDSSPFGEGQVRRYYYGGSLGAFGDHLEQELRSDVGERHVTDFVEHHHAAVTTHEHPTGVACDDVPDGQKRPEFGCFNIATEEGLQFQQPEVYWHLRAFPNRTAAEADKSASGSVGEDDGRV